MNELHLFAGAGGGILGGMLLGHTCVCAVENNPFRRKVLLQRQRDEMLPWFPIWDDIRTFDALPWRGVVDVVCGGFPCQGLSTRGKHDGIDGSTTGLWREMLRVVSDVQPEYVFMENSPVIIRHGLALVLGEIAKLGYNAAWCRLGASDVRGSHHRKRAWILAHSRSIRSPRGRSQKPETKYPTEPFLLLDTPPRPGAQCQIQRMDDGLANRVERLRAIGDGQVPAVVVLAWNVLAARLMSNN